MGVDEKTVLSGPTGGQKSPYAGLNSRAFWRSGVAKRAPLHCGDVYSPRSRIGRKHRIMTAGSCFAQHVGRTLRESGFNVIDEESLPEVLHEHVGRSLGFRQYSARYGNIYTTRQLHQLLSEAYGTFAPTFPVWEKDGAYYDAQRPGIEPFGQISPESVLHQREAHLAAVRRAVEQADVFVFTLGLTEAWVHTETGTVYPTAPGTIAGHFDPDQFSFVNFNYTQVLDDFMAARAILKQHRPKLRFLLTVSPVPLTATASGQHVEVATCYSKSTLRAVCGSLYASCDDVDYFPSFEIITSQAARGVYYRPNLREVSEQGVSAAMSTFMAAHGAKKANHNQPAATNNSAADVACEDALLEAFGQ